MKKTIQLGGSLSQIAARNRSGDNASMFETSLAGETFPVTLQAALYGLLDEKAASSVYVLGRRIVFKSTSPFQDLAQYLVNGQSAINVPVSSTTYYLVSTSANDVAGNTGAYSVRIVYLDANGYQQKKNVNLNGLTAVNIGSGYSYIQWMEVDLAGSNNTAVGDVTISSINGSATEGTTIEMIKAGGNRSLSGRYKVPQGYNAFIYSFYASAPGSQAMDVRLRAKVFSDDRGLSSAFHFQSLIYAASGAELERSIGFYKYPAGCEIKLSCLPQAITGTPRCDASFELLLVGI